MDLGVVGAGYVGLVAAACLASLGHRVTCVDIDGDRVARLNRGIVPIMEANLDRLIGDAVAKNRLSFTSNAAALRETSLVMVGVGTLDRAGAWTTEVVRSAVLGIAADRSAPRSIVIRSTLIPGTASRLAREMVAIDPSITLAINPEFTREGSAVSDFLRPDRVVIGTDKPMSNIVDDLSRIYEPLGAPILVTDLTSAEMIKLASNVYLAAKITFANEVARLCGSMGANVADVVEGMGLDGRIGRAFLSPGPGYGGSCLPAQSRALPALGARLGVTTPMIDAIGLSNECQGRWLIDQAETALGRELYGKRVAVLGLTFKAGTDDLRESPALRLVAALAEAGANISVHDPIATEKGADELARLGITVQPANSAVEACRGAEVVFVATEWPQYADLDWHEVRDAMTGDCIVDGRAILSIELGSAAGLRIVGLPRYQTATSSDLRRPDGDIRDEPQAMTAENRTRAEVGLRDFDRELRVG